MPWPDTHQILLYLHVGGAILLIGTGIGTAFHGLVNYRNGGVRTVAVSWRTVELADWLFTAPAAIAQPLTGLGLILVAGWDWREPWLMASYGLYAIIGVCWLPVVWIQIRIARLARSAADSGASQLPPACHRLFRIWVLLGIPAFVAIALLLALMLWKPSF